MVYPNILCFRPFCMCETGKTARTAKARTAKSQPNPGQLFISISESIACSPVDTGGFFFGQLFG